MMGMERGRVEARRSGVPYEVQPVTFSFGAPVETLVKLDGAKE